MLGILYQIAGLAYLTNGFALILAPQFGGRVFAVIAGPAFIGEASLCLWLLVKGVNMEKWNRWRAHEVAWHENSYCLQTRLRALRGCTAIHRLFLRLVFLLMFLFVGYDSWSYILNHQGS